MLEGNDVSSGLKWALYFEFCNHDIACDLIYHPDAAINGKFLLYRKHVVHSPDFTALPVAGSRMSGLRLSRGHVDFILLLPL